MSSSRFTIVAVLAGFLAGCERGSEPAGPFNQKLGASAAALPTARGRSDLGILKEPKDYKPAAEVGKRGPAITGDEREQVRVFAEQIRDEFDAGNVDGVIEKFVPEHVAALREQLSAVYETVEKRQGFDGVVDGKLGKTPLDDVKAIVARSVKADISVDVQDGENASVTPNVLAHLLGPRAGQVLAVKRVGEEWKVSLDRPLDAAGATAIAEFHKQVQAEIDALIEQIDTGKLAEPEKIAAAYLEALRGNPPPAGDAGGAAGGGDEAQSQPSDAASGEAPKPDDAGGDEEEEVRPRDRRPEPEPEKKPEPEPEPEVTP
ncbi:MAG: hypothetical protein CHACPFDD_03212 [Phycisphaerae bacterium]|nr:hypothetical protein [Phycisphaerae bacterium]